MQPSFIHLRVHSAYSLAEGAVKVKDLVKLCQKLNMPAVAVTDSCNLFGALEFSVAAADSGVQPITGAILYIAQDLVKDHVGH
jgi:DNA polymerase-3 subunit alpha